MDVYKWDESEEIFQVWVPRYEGIYYVDWEGVIRSVDREVRFIRKGGEVTRKLKGKQLKVFPHRANGRMMVALSNDGILEYVYVGRTVLEAFDIPSGGLTNTKPIDGDLTNCAGWNLEWCE